MSDINGILKLSNSQKDIVIKLENLIDISNEREIWVTIDGSDLADISNNIRLNGVKLSSSTISLDNVIAYYKDVSSAIVTLSIDDYIITEDKQLNMNVSVNNSSYNFPIYITNNTLGQYKFYDKSASMIASNMESFMLLRTNPKLTGNVKLVVTEDYNLYLDTFKISQNSILNKQEYRHQAIGSNGDYPHDVYHVFKFLPATEMYGIYPDSYDPHISYHKAEDQIRNIYEYGAEYNSDKMYSENMKILAPLYIGKHLPTFFAIWRSDRLLTSDNTATNTQIFRTLLNDAKCIKIFDLRRSTSIGKYLNNYHDMITKYLAGTCILQFIEQDTDKTSVNHRQGQNIWKGVAYDKGILTDRNETTYFATKILNAEHPQENYNMFLLNGFSRNNLLYPNIINLEFMFNDPEAEDFSMHNYFGLYLTENDFLSFNQVIKNGNDNNYTLDYYDTSNNIIKLDTTTISIIENADYKDRIFFATTNNAVTDLKTMDDFNLFAKNEAANKPYENIIQIGGSKLNIPTEDRAFLSMDFTKQIRYGEHFKFIIPKYEITESEAQHVVFEIIASNDIRLIDTDNNISPYVQTNTTRRPTDIQNVNTKIYRNQDNNTKIYRVAFYTQDLNDETTQAPLVEQIQRLSAAIGKFDSVLRVGSDGAESISIISTVKDVYFQHIIADEYFDDEVVNDTLRYYNYNNVQPCEYIEYNNDLYKLNHMPFANNGLEETLNRYANIVKFINFENFKNKYIYEIDKDIYDEANKVQYPLIYTVNGYYPMSLFNNNDGDLVFIDTVTAENSKFSLDGDNWISIISPYGVEKSIICSPFEVEFVNRKLNICSPMPLNVALMGINNVKDLDVYTNNEIIENHRTSISATFKAGETVKLDNVDPRIKRFVTYTIISGSIQKIPAGAVNSFTILSDKIIYTNINNELNEVALVTNEIVFTEDTEIMLTSINSLDVYNYDVHRPVLNEDYYYINSVDKNHSNLSIPLVPLINCQWKSNGTYFDTNSILDTHNLLNLYEIEGNFIECQYTPGVNNQYIIDSLYDVINVNGNNEHIYDYILKTGHIKKYLCNNNKIQTAIGYYNPYVQTLEFIFYGIKFVFKLSSNEYSNEIKLNEFDNYEVFIINDFNNTNTNEIIISKTEEFILIINHVFNNGYYYGNENVKTYKNGLIQDAEYNWFKTPFSYNLIDSTKIGDSIYIKKSNSYILNDVKNTKAFVELDLDLYDNNTFNFKETPNYAYFTINQSTYNSKEKHDIYKLDIDIYSNEKNKVFDISRGYDNIIDKYQYMEFDFRQKEGYVVKMNKTNPGNQVVTSGKEKITNFINSFDSNYDIYIIEDGNNNTIQDPIKITNIYKPLTIQTSIPDQIKFNNGLFDPNFVDIFNFNLNDPISEKLNIDTLYGNTQISSINSIINYYNNKVIDNKSNYVFNYFLEENRSLFSTNWDNNIYRQYDSEYGYKNLAGYALGIEDKMFFGSKVINLHNNAITLDKWNYQKNINKAALNISKHNEHSKAKQVLEIQLNLTKTFYDFNFNNKNLVNNWKGIKQQTDIKIYINNYINNVLYNIYNFKGNFDIILYKQYDEFVSSQPIEDHFVLEGGILSEPEIDTNYKTEFKDINNEVILTITIDNFDNYKYYPIVKINKI